MRVQHELKGIVVVGAHGRVVGEIDDVEIDPSAWRVTGIVVKVDAEAVVQLGLKKPFWSKARVTIPIDHVSGVTDVLVVDVPLERLGALLADARAEGS